MALLQRDSGREVQPGGHPKGTRANTLAQVFFVLFCLEIGFVLLLLPWTDRTSCWLLTTWVPTVPVTRVAL